MGYRIKIERRARSRFLKELRDWHVSYVATILYPGPTATTYSHQPRGVQLDPQDLLYNKPLPSQCTNDQELQLSESSLL